MNIWRRHLKVKQTESLLTPYIRGKLRRNRHNLLRVVLPLCLKITPIQLAPNLGEYYETADIDDV